MNDLVRVVFTFVAITNPPRTALTAPADAEPAQLWGAAAVTTAAAAVLAVISDPLLDLLDVSSESFRIGTGAVLAAGGIRDLVARPEPFDTVAAGWRGVAAPLVFPLLLSAELLMASVSFGTDEGVVPTTAAAAVGLAAAVAVTVGRRSSIWAGRIVAALLVTFGFELVVSGVLDI